MSQICKNCAHWDKVFQVRWTGEVIMCRDGFGICKSGKIIYVHDEDNPPPDEIPKDSLSFGDGEQYYAWHEVGEQFGCIHFKNK